MTIQELSKLNILDIEMFDLENLKGGAEKRHDVAVSALESMIGLGIENLDKEYSRKSVTIIQKIEQLLFSKEYNYELLEYTPNSDTGRYGSAIIVINDYAKLYFGCGNYKYGKFQKVILNFEIQLIPSVSQ